MSEHNSPDPTPANHLDEVQSLIAQIVMQMARKVTQLRKENERGSNDIPQRVKETAAHLSEAIDRLESRVSIPAGSPELGPVQVERQKMLSRVHDLRVYLHSELAAVLETEKTPLSGNLASSLAALIAAESTEFPEPSLN
tara:strand:- start:14786 stop:15205 length:420 start_codon:yes stop_codon:yes gene_type:complete